MLEVVDVDEDDGHREEAFVAALGRARELVAQAVAVEHAGERVALGHVGQMPRVLAQLLVQALEGGLAVAREGEVAPQPQRVQQRPGQREHAPERDDAQAERGRRDDLAGEVDAVQPQLVVPRLHVAAGRYLHGHDVVHLRARMLGVDRVLVGPPRRDGELRQARVQHRTRLRVVDEFLHLGRAVLPHLRVQRVEVQHEQAQLPGLLGALERRLDGHRAIGRQVDALGRLGQLEDERAVRPGVAGADLAVHHEVVAVAAQGRAGLAAR